MIAITIYRSRQVTRDDSRGSYGSKWDVKLRSGVNCHRIVTLCRGAQMRLSRHVYVLSPPPGIGQSCRRIRPRGFSSGVPSDATRTDREEVKQERGLPVLGAGSSAPKILSSNARIIIQRGGPVGLKGEKKKDGRGRKKMVVKRAREIWEMICRRSRGRGKSRTRASKKPWNWKSRRAAPLDAAW